MACQPWARRSTPASALGRTMEVMKMTLKIHLGSLKSLGRFAVAIKSWVVGGPGDDARVGSLYAYRDGEQRPCPGPYALLAGVARR
jgi:hypothetical protein